MSNVKKFFAKELKEELKIQHDLLKQEFDEQLKMELALAEFSKQDYETKIKNLEAKLSNIQKSRYGYDEIAVFDPSRLTFTMKMEITEDAILDSTNPITVVEHACKQMFDAAITAIQEKYPLLRSRIIKCHSTQSYNKMSFNAVVL